MKLDKNQTAFLELLKAGLWKQRFSTMHFPSSEAVVWKDIYCLAEEQSVVGLVASGLELDNIVVPKDVKLQFVGTTLQLEQRNAAMNQFIEGLMAWLQRNGVKALLVKGQGVAQCYERPLWRTCGDVDLLLNSENYENARKLLSQKGLLVSKDTEKNKSRLNAEYSIDEWIVELHGTQHADLSKRMDRELDTIQEIMFSESSMESNSESGSVIIWKCGETNVLLPGPEQHIMFVFAHILQHLFLGGIGLRQICDWSRMLWKHKEYIDLSLLETWIKKMGVMTEWQVLGALTVEYLGTPVEAIPFYDSKSKEKASLLMDYVLEVGNFGHNKDHEYQNKYSGKTRKLITLWRQAKDSARLACIFPVDSPRFLGQFFINGVKELFV